MIISSKEDGKEPQNEGFESESQMDFKSRALLVEQKIKECEFQISTLEEKKKEESNTIKALLAEIEKYYDDAIQAYMLRKEELLRILQGKEEKKSDQEHSAENNGESIDCVDDEKVSEKIPTYKLKYFSFNKSIYIPVFKKPENSEEKEEIDKKNFLDCIKLEKVVEDFKHSISSICLTKDGRLAASTNKHIKIFNLESYKCDFKIMDHSSCVNYVSLLESGDLISSSCGGTMKIFSIQGNDYKCLYTFKTHKDSVNKAIQISGDRIGSCSKDKTIRIYNSFEPYTCTEILNNHTKEVTSFIELRNKKYIVSCGNDNILCFLDNKTYKVYKSITNIDGSSSGLIETTGGVILVGSSDLCVIDVETQQILRKFKKTSSVTSMIELPTHSVICGTAYGNFFEISKNAQKIKALYKNAHSKGITGMLITENGKMISSSSDQTCIIWESSIS